MLKYLSTTSLLLLILVWLSACGEATPVAAPQTTEEVEATRGVLQMSHTLIWDGNESLDPVSPVNFIYASVLLYDRLVRLDENETPRPELATAWEANAEATAWTFTLRDDVTFHDGQAFTSADVAYTFEHILDPDAQSPMASTFDMISEMETPDEQTIIFNLAQGHASFPILVGNFWAGIIPAESAETIGETGIGTGPFKLETLNATGVTVLTANDDYWKGVPGLAGVDLISLPDIEGRTLAAQAGQIDLLYSATAVQAVLFEDQAEFEVLSFPSGSWNGLVMRTDTPPFDDVRVRRAMRLVADRQAIIDLTLDGQGTIACDTPVAPTDIYRQETDCPRYIAQAQALLAEAGYADGLDVTLYTSNSDPQLITLAEVYQQQAAEAGINVTLEIAPADSYWSEVWMVEPFVVTFWPGRPADQALNETWRSTAQWNESYFQSPEFDQLLDDARQELDFERRREAYQAAQQLLFEEGGHLIPYHANEFNIVSTKLSGVPAKTWHKIEWHLISKSE